MDKGAWVKEGGPPCGGCCTARGGLLAAAEAAFVVVVVGAQSPRSSRLRPQELSKGRVIEVVSRAPCADQQSFID
jgi:hypothetical protein